jgi:hypothetical protein
MACVEKHPKSLSPIFEGGDQQRKIDKAKNRNLKEYKGQGNTEQEMKRRATVSFPSQIRNSTPAPE